MTKALAIVDQNDASRLQSIDVRAWPDAVSTVPQLIVRGKGNALQAVPFGGFVHPPPRSCEARRRSARLEWLKNPNNQAPLWLQHADLPRYPGNAAYQAPISRRVPIHRMHRTGLVRAGGSKVASDVTWCAARKAPICRLSPSVMIAQHLPRSPSKLHRSSQMISRKG